MITHAKGRRESALESWCVKWARARGVVVAKLTECAGIPDRVFFVPGGRPLIVEFKAVGLKPEELQSWYLRMLFNNCYIAVHIDSKEAFMKLMNRYSVGEGT